MVDIDTLAQELSNSLPDDADVELSEIKDSLDELINDFNVGEEEAVSATKSKVLQDYEGDGSTTRSGGDPAQDEDVSLGDLAPEHDEQWFNVRGEVTRLFDLNENQEEYITQRGVLADDTGTTLFTVFNDVVEEDPSAELEVGETYELLGVVGELYNDDVSIELTTSTTINETEDTFEPPENDISITGPIVDIQNGSGLVKRCSVDDCSYVLNSGQCSQHGDVEGEHDLRLKTIIDDGTTPHQVYFGREATEAITDIKLEQAIEIAKDAMDTEAVADEMEIDLLGRYYHVAGGEGAYVFVNEFSRIERDRTADEEVEELRASISDLKERVSA